MFDRLRCWAATRKRGATYNPECDPDTEEELVSILIAELIRQDVYMDPAFGTVLVDGHVDFNALARAILRGQK